MKAPRYKERVLARFPDAKPAVTTLWPDGTPRHITIISGNLRLEMKSPGNSDWWDENLPRNYREAWKEAFYWCVMHPTEKVQSDLFTEERKKA